MVEAFNKILENELTKICSICKDDWDRKVSVVLWAYHTTCKRLKRNTPFILVYGQEAIVPMEYIVSSLRVVVLMNMTDGDALEKRLSQLVQMEEERFTTGFHQTVENHMQKAWHACHI